MGFQLGKFLKRVACEGCSSIIDGRMGSGKTSFAVTMMHMLVSGTFPELGPYEAITNIQFRRRDASGRLVMDFPPGVHYATELSEMIRITGTILKRHSGRVTILMVLDEAQNYMIADSNYTKENQALVKFIANIRKLNIATMFITPTYRNLVPRIREFSDTGKGTCSVYWHLDPDMSVREGHNPRERVYVRICDDMDWFPISIRQSPWSSVPVDSLPTGGFSYYTKAIASFSIGRNSAGRDFDVYDFLTTCSNDDRDVWEVIGEYFDRWDREGGEEDDVMLHIRDQALRVRRMREVGVKWEDIAYIEGEPKSTVESRYRKYWSSRSEGTVDARVFPISESSDGRARIYKTLRPGKGGLGNPPLGKGDDEGCSA